MIDMTLLDTYDWTLIAEAVDNLYHHIEEQSDILDREDDQTALARLQTLFNGSTP